MDNLNRRRKERGSLDDNARLSESIRNYKAHLDKCYVGRSVLDVGCGHQYLKQCLPPGTSYLGMDAFPVVPNTFHAAIDELNFMCPPVETVCCFATLDGVRDFDIACERMKEIATKNIIILTGIGIEVNQYHTHRLEFEDFDRAFGDWNNTVRHMVSDKVWLLEYARP